MGRILVTGGAGFIGSHLVIKLLQKGYDVIIIDDFSNGRMENLSSIRKDVEIIKFDISAKKMKMQNILKEKKCDDFDGIFHLACHPRSLSLDNPYRDLEVNAQGMLNVLELAKLYNCKVVFTSNSGIYGNPKYLPIDEKHPDSPTTPYDANKLVAEYYCKIFNREFGVHTVICRLATVFGERQRTKPGWKPVIAEFITKILNGIQPTIYGDGNQTRDFIYVLDVVQGLIKAFESKNTDGEVFILGTNIETSINQLFQLITDLTRKKIIPKHGPPSKGDIRRMKYDYSKAKKCFGFEPKTKLKKGIEKTIYWYKTN